MSHPHRDAPRGPMTDSGVLWFGKVPSQWTLRRFKFCGTIPNGQVDPRLPEFRSFILIAPNHIESVSGRILSTTETAEEQGADSGKYLAQKGDVIYSKIRPELQKACLAPVTCLCSADMYPISPAADMTAEYLLYTLLSDWFTKYAVLWSDRVAMPKVNRETLGNCPVLVPPLSEQRAITAFLDRKTAEIDAVIGAKERMIGLLQEQRLTLISQAVMQGLDPSVPTKDSGVKWVTPIPAHWRMVQLKHLARIQTGVTLGKVYSEPTQVFPYLRVANVQDGSFHLDDITELAVPPAEAARCTLQAGDVLMTEGGDLDKLGRGSVWRGQIDNCLHQNHVFAVRPHAKLLTPDFLAYLTRAAHGREYFTLTGQKTTNLASTNVSKVGAFPIPLPPILEQQAICQHIDRETARIDRLITLNREQIARLREYRLTLISSAVTGKLNVMKEVAP